MEKTVFVLLICLHRGIQEKTTLLKPHFPPVLTFLPLHTLHLYSYLFPLSTSCHPPLPFRSLFFCTVFLWNSSNKAECLFEASWRGRFSIRVSTRLQAESSFFEQINARPATVEGCIWLHSNTLRWKPTEIASQWDSNSTQGVVGRRRRWKKPPLNSNNHAVTQQGLNRELLEMNVLHELVQHKWLSFSSTSLSRLTSFTSWVT